MKTTPFLLLALALAAGAAAADLPLADGRVLKDATIVSQTPRTVIVKHAGGLGSIAKGLLPAELQVRYPLDEAAAREADERAVRATEAAREAEQAEAERRAKLRSQLEDRTAEQRTAAKQTEQREEERQTAVHRAKAERLVRDALRDGIVSVDEFRSVNGCAGPWVLTGTVTVTSYAEIRTYCDEVNVSPGNIPYYRWPGMEEAQRLQPRSSYTRSFEAIYSLDGPTPAISLMW